jgi:hypothetical protein
MITNCCTLRELAFLQAIEHLIRINDIRIAAESNVSAIRFHSVDRRKAGGLSRARLLKNGLGGSVIRRRRP